MMSIRNFGYGSHSITKSIALLSLLLQDLVLSQPPEHQSKKNPQLFIIRKKKNITLRIVDISTKGQLLYRRRMQRGFTILVEFAKLIYVVNYRGRIS